MLRSNGIPEEQIIHFSFDDVASHRENPFKGQLFNKPNGQDVYEGCNIDYREHEVTPDKFIGAITGSDKMRSEGKKVLRSNKQSKVFMYIANHGAHGLVAFPNKEILYADDFAKAMKTMHDKGMYSEMVIYMEGSNSGSMFEDVLPDNIKIYGMAASGAKESAFGTYCYPDDKVNGEHIGTCLGDVFSVNWIEDTEKSDLTKEDLDTQFNRVKALTKDFSRVS
jgi:legumain